MDRDRWLRIQELFHAATELEGAERLAFLDAECASDERLRVRVEALLVADDRAEKQIGGAIEGVLQLASEESANGAAGRPHPERIGIYHIVRELGRGGLSTVYLAERDDDQYQMQVAIKVIRRGMDTDDILDRLRQERQILARLEHPNVARLLDGGSTEDGQPFVVMEYIRGELIDEYCDLRRLSIRERLELFLHVCSAVRYAHQSLVIHRDIKPGNLLVTADGIPKLLDFGIAKLLDPDLVRHPVAATAAEVRLLTPDYASPEQIRGEALTTATDIYSLGVLLYVLLTGEPPYAVPRGQRRELERVICETEPEKPSTVVGRRTVPLARRPRHFSPRKARQQLRGDLDTLVLTALAKEPGRRYASVEALAEDVRRHLNSLPILARKPTLRYRYGKFIRRNRMAVMAFVLFLAGVAATLWQARNAVTERTRAERNLARAEVVSTFLTDLFKLSDPGEALGETITAREILDRGMREMARGNLKDDPEIQASLMNTMGQVYRNLGLYEEAEPLLSQALEIRRDGGSEAELTESLVSLGGLRFDQGDNDTAEALLREALERRTGLLGPRHRRVATVLHDLGLVLEARGDFTRAEDYLRQGLEFRQEWDDNDLDVAQSQNDLGELLYKKGDLDGAKPLFLAALEQRREILDEEHPEVSTSLNNLAVLHFARGDLAAAEDLLREVLRLKRKVQGAEHPEIASSLNNLAAVLEFRGDLDGAGRFYRQALEVDRKSKGAIHRDVAHDLANLAGVLEKQGDFATAASLFQEALSIRRRLWGEKNTSVALTVCRLARAELALKQDEAAERHFRQAIATLRELTTGVGDLNLAHPLVRLGLLLTAQGRREEAEPLLREGIKIRREAGHGDKDATIIEAQAALAG